MSGAALRYWLSTAIPFDTSELAALSGAAVRNHSVRVPFIMFSGLGLLAFYLLVRRSAGVPAAFAALFLLQSSLGFQEWALRIRVVTFALPIGLGALTWWRHTRPPWRPPPAAARVLLALALLLALRGVFLGVTLPGRLASIRDGTAADAQAFYASVVACGGGIVTPLEALRSCPLAWPSQRSLAQQEALLIHAQQLRDATLLRDGSESLPPQGHGRVAVFDRAGLGLFVVGEGEEADIALRVIGARAGTDRHGAPR